MNRINRLRILMAGCAAIMLPVTAVLAGQPKVSICHNGRTITVAAPAARAHLNHGDSTGSCAVRDTTVRVEQVEASIVDTTTLIHRYLYYPKAQVYFDAGREMYFYQQDGLWAEARLLPDNLRQMLGEFISVEQQGASPASFHDVFLATLGASSDVLPWAPESGATAYEYLYYPDARVYFDPARELYFYQSQGDWLGAPTLLAELREQLGDFVSLEMGTAQPYEYHQAVLGQYGGLNTTQTPAWQQGEEALNSYLYYPTVGAYYAPERSLYFYRHEGEWLKAPTLAADLQQGLDRFVTLDMRTREPYEYHEAVNTSYGDLSLGQVVAGVATGVATQIAEQHLQENSLAGYHYRYYPDNNVYYDEVRQVYFHQQDDQWVDAPTLPGTLSEALGAFLSMTLDTPQPYQRQQLVLDAWRSGAAQTRTESYQYQYFPGTDIYYEPAAERYFYQQGGAWQSASSLPTGLQVDLQTGGTLLDLATDQPYLYHRQVIQQLVPAAIGAVSSVTVRRAVSTATVNTTNANKEVRRRNVSATPPGQSKPRGQGRGNSGNGRQNGRGRGSKGRGN